MVIILREYIINNFSNSPIKDLEESIETSISSNEEEPLFGLGVLFEILWKSSSNNERQKILNTIYNKIIEKK